MILSRAKSVLVVALLVAGAGRSSADDWPRWRGPHLNGISTETGWLDVWPAGGPPILWKAEVGMGFSSTVVAGGRVYTLGNANEKDTVSCLDAETGRLVWSQSYPADLGAKYFDGGTTNTPTVDGDRVYTMSRWGEVFCFDAATGKIVWSKNVKDETEIPLPGWGYGGSPFISGDLLILNVGSGGLAMEKTTGKVVWKSGPEEGGYSTPFPYRKGDEEFLIVSSGRTFSAVNPKTGREAWRVKWVTEYGVNAADPIVDGDRVFLSTGYGKGAALLQLGGREPQVLWQSKSIRTQMNPCVFLGGHLYGVDGDTTQKTFLKCIELATGQEKWSRPLAGSGAVSAADGKLIVLSGEGELMVGPASPAGFTPSAQAKVLESKCWTVPVLANGRIYARNSTGRLVCVDVKKR